jgi:hypothetical protein
MLVFKFLLFHILLFYFSNFNVEMQFVASNNLILVSLQLAVPIHQPFAKTYSATQPSCDVLPQARLLTAALGMVIDPSFRALPIKAVAEAKFPFAKEAK